MQPENTCYQLAINLKTLNQKRQENLAKKNSKQLNENSYKCPLCSDTGWIIKYRDDGSSYCLSCECREKEKLKRHWKATGINIENTTLTFSNFKEWNESAKKAKAIAISYFNNFLKESKNKQNSILFCGQVGSGKTHLSIALALNLIKKNYKVIYMPYRDTITKIKQNLGQAESYLNLISKYKTCEVLLIDDLYKGKITETDINIMFEIINYRYLNHLPLIISTEFSIDKLLSFDESIGSRIYEMCKNYIVMFKSSISNNYRLRKE